MKECDQTRKARPVEQIFGASINGDKLFWMHSRWYHAWYCKRKRVMILGNHFNCNRIACAVGRAFVLLRAT